ncbi:MAG: hypothetical protein H7831_09330 [Magnetococcus sp. WYHC-3]
MATRMGRWIALGCLTLALMAAGCTDRGDQSAESYVALESGPQQRLPLAPHVRERQAKPTQDMIHGSQGVAVRFRVLDKRTQTTQSLTARVGTPQEGPWEGDLRVVAFVPDLMLGGGAALHGPEGHVNPAVWVEIYQGRDRLLHDGWLFARDSAQTAWDHHRFDLTFLGPDGVVTPPPAPELAPPADEAVE